MSKLKLEVGKSYRTRIGEKVIIQSHETGNKFFRFEGRGDNDWILTFTETGNYCVNKLSGNDIISEWEDEPKLHNDINTNESILQEAERIINGDRAEAYGDAKESFENVAKGWTVIFGKEVTGRQVGLAMAWLKICRENNNHKRDNLVDLAGYAALIEKLSCTN